MCKFSAALAAAALMACTMPGRAAAQENFTAAMADFEASCAGCHGSGGGGGDRAPAKPWAPTVT